MTRTVTGPVCPLRDAHVPCHFPSLRDCSRNGGSPLENVRNTVPSSCAEPQSSLTSTATAAGHPTGTLAPWPSERNDGIKRLAVQPSAARELSLLSAALMTTLTSTRRTAPSANCSDNSVR